MKKHIIHEQTGISYTLCNDYYVPDLILPEQEHYDIGRFGRMRLQYLKNHRKCYYTTLLTQCKLNAHLHEIDVAAREMFDLIVRQMAESGGLTEELKATDQMKWVGLMNNYRHCAEEIVLSEVVYA